MGVTPTLATVTERQARARLARLTRTARSVDRRHAQLTQRRADLAVELADARRQYQAIRARERGEVAS
jgi:chorismate mutase